MSVPPSLLSLTAGGTSLILDTRPDGLPRVIHWGTAIEAGDLDSMPDVMRAGSERRFPSLLPLQAEAWAGRPGLAGDREGRWPHLRLKPTAPPAHTEMPGGASALHISSADAEAEIAVTITLFMSGEGVARIQHTVTNLGQTVWALAAVRAVLPLPDHAVEVLDMTGRWGLERVPQRSAFVHGAHARESRRGVPGHDATTLLVAGTERFGFRHGQVWATHVAWSGDTEYAAERHTGTSGVLAAGELLAPGEIRLARGESYTSPWVYFVHSDTGLDGIGDRLHQHLRSRPGHPRTPRPVILNTWEAVYFNHDLERLKALADRGREVGVERFVLDDGWLRHRRADDAGLGDWYVDDDVWPEGLHPLIKHVHALEMDFGLWVEPEMVNPDSDLARAHPHWLLAAPGRLPAAHRNQHVLDLARPEVSAYLFARLDSLLTEYPIAYLKWDHNRPLVEAVHDCVAGVHAQTRAVYQLIDRLRAAHHTVEIESCASGGGRIDLGIIERTDRVWVSDTNDPIDRQHIQRHTGLLLPPELMGSHVGPTTAHVTGRTTRLSLRCATALFGHAGIEWDLTTCTHDELAELTRWTRAYKRLRDLLHTGATVRLDLPDPAALAHGVVAQDKTRAVFSYVQTGTPLEETPLQLRLAGLDHDTVYRVTACPELTPHTRIRGPLAEDGVSATGRVLATVGLTLPRPVVADAYVLELEALR